MVSRRMAVAGGLGLVTAGSISGLAAQTGQSYAEALRTTWAPIEPSGNASGSLNELVRAATLAPNNHNVQPWIFLLGDRQMTIKPDLSRRCPVVDPTDHHLYVSLGCAAENIVQAAGLMGLAAVPKFDVDADALSIDLSSATVKSTELSRAISRRQSTRGLYDGKPVPTDQLQRLADAGRGEGVDVTLLTDRQKIDGVRDFILQGNTAQIADKGFVRELKSWIRFNEREALATRDGLFTATTGNPELPSWIAPLLFNYLLTARGENDKYSKQIASSSGLAIFFSARADKVHWIEIGRAVQRFCLTATALGLKVAFLNQPIEVARVRPQLEAYLGLGGQTADIVMRFGAGSDMPRSLRRPVDQVVARA